MARVLGLLLLCALLVPTAGAQPTTIDFVLTLREGAAPVYEGPPGLLTLEQHKRGENLTWNVSLTKNYTVGEIRVERAFDVERPEQVVPLLFVPGSDFPLFHLFPNDRVWDVDGPARVYRYNGSADAFVLRVGIPGPVNGTFSLQRDVVPPSYTLGPITNLKPRDFYRETRTNELAYADLQVREKGTTEWIQNPTTVPHVYHKFPVQGLDPDRDYEIRLLFTDFSGNVNESPIETLRTPPLPIVPKPVVTPLTPVPNATAETGEDVVVLARVESAIPVRAEQVRIFFDKREVTEGIRFDGTNVSYAVPGRLSAGVHSVSIEATNEEGGLGVARWTFEVRGNQTPGASLAALGVALVAGALLARRRR